MLHVPDKLRVCNICGCTSEDARFYPGVTSRCAECHKKSVRRNRAEKIDYYREYYRARAKTPKAKEQKRKFNKTPRGRAICAASIQRWREKYPGKRQAHIKVANALRDGLIYKPSSCEVCGTNERKLHGHHTDYSKPLEVIWVCPPCHREFHR
jgi:hypothetical protein